jgi:hypothetical protein
LIYSAWRRREEKYAHKRLLQEKILSTHTAISGQVIPGTTISPRLWGNIAIQLAKIKLKIKKVDSSSLASS